MKVAFDLPPVQAQKLRQEAERLGLKPDDLARAALVDLLATRDEDFKIAADRVLRKNEDLYRRLVWMRYLTLGEVGSAGPKRPVRGRGTIMCH